MMLLVINAPTVVIGVMIALLFAAIVFRGVRRRKRGEGGCGCGCSGCPHSALCHGEGHKEKGDRRG